MKPNGKNFAVSVVLSAVCAVGLFSGRAGAETVRGTFKLISPTHLGAMVLAPGEYEFTVDTGSVNRVLTVRSEATGWSGMILPAAIDGPSGSSGSEIKLARTNEATYVEALYLNDAGVALTFRVPKRSMSHLAKSPPMKPSASGTN